MNEEILKRMHTCPCCNKEVGFNMKYLKGIGDAKSHRACFECADEYFEKVKSQYFIEEYKGNNIYKWNNFYFPYWEARYAYNSLEQCRNRIDNNTVAVVDMDSYSLVNLLVK